MRLPKRFLTRMVLFLGAVFVVAVILYPMLRDAFLANIALNGMILGVLVIGVGFIFRQVLLLYPEVTWVENYRQNRAATSTQQEPHLLGPMSSMLGERKENMRISALSLRSILDGISARLDESRDISRYLIGLLIFLGLLGTFWGLLETVSSVGGVISGLGAATGDFRSVFADLKNGLEAPLSGMSTAFSSSLFGLAGSLVLGFLDLQAGQAQNRFYNDLEEWLAGITRLSSGSALAEGDQSIPVYIQALLEQNADNLENLRTILARNDERQANANNSLVTLNERLGSLTDHLRNEQNLMVRLAESQIEMKPILERLANASRESSQGMDEASRSHLRNIDIRLTQLLEDMSSGRHELVSEIRSEMKLLARTIAALDKSRDTP